MEFLQFAQAEPGALPLAGLAQNASRYFDATLEVAELPPGPGGIASASVTLNVPRHPNASFTLTLRAAGDADYARLRAAERANQSHGMADLGRRCPSVWQVTPQAPASAAVSYFFGALLASVALGPLLPSDDSGLYGVRSARLRAEELSKH